MNYDLQIKNGQVITENGLQRVDLSIKDGKIVQIGKASQSDTSTHEIDAQGQYVLRRLLYGNLCCCSRRYHHGTRTSVDLSPSG